MRADGYIVSRRYDWAFFLLPPSIGLLLGLVLSSASEEPVAPGAPTGLALFSGVLIHAHLVAVFLRSHGNHSIRKRHRAAFFVVPPLLFVALLASEWFCVLALVVATVWDVWHSGAQTFGLARIYDRNSGNSPSALRRFDFWANQLLYAGPILGGATLMAHVAVFEDFGEFDDPLSLLFARAPGTFEANASILTWVVLIGGGGFVLAYLGAYLAARKRGYRAPFQKVFLVSTTAACSIVAWGFNSWGEAFFIMNFFHAVQYLALIWFTEGERLTSTLGLSRWARGGSAAALVFLTAVAIYGLAVQWVDPTWHAFWALTMVVSLMHFWYDAFIWSVRSGDV